MSADKTTLTIAENADFRDVNVRNCLHVIECENGVLDLSRECGFFQLPALSPDPLKSMRRLAIPLSASLAAV
jgi:hypothetical protein